MTLNAAKPVVPRILLPQERPNRWRLTYAFELQYLTVEGTAIEGANIVVNLPINPTRYNVRAPLANEKTATVGGVSVEESGFIMQEVEIAGTCGLRTKRGWDSTGSLIFADGNTLWRELRRMFQLYAEQQKVLSSLSGVTTTVRMVFHDFRNDDHWVVIPEDFNFERNAAEHRLHYPYEIKLTAVADDDQSDLGAGGVFAEVQAGIGQVVQAVNNLVGYAEDARAFVDETNQVIAGSINAVLGAVRDLADAAAGLRNGLRDTFNLPLAAGYALRDTVDRWRDALTLQFVQDGTEWSPTDSKSSDDFGQLELANTMADEFDGILSNRDVWADASWSEEQSRFDQTTRGEALLSTTEIQQAQFDAITDTNAGKGLTARATAGSALRTASTESAAPGRTYTGQRPYVVRRGDTLTSIATREMGTTEVWQDIAIVNRLSAPFISQFGEPGTVWVGDTIMIPTFEQGPEVLPGVITGRSEEQILGVDLELSDGTWHVDDSGTDVLLTRGADNFFQALSEIRFRTELGKNLVFPRIGILTPIGRPQGNDIPEAVAVSVRRAAYGDRRTSSIEKLELIAEGDTVEVDIVVIPQGTRTGRVMRVAVE